MAYTQLGWMTTSEQQVRPHTDTLLAPLMAVVAALTEDYTAPDLDQTVTAIVGPALSRENLAHMDEGITEAHRLADEANSNANRRVTEAQLAGAISNALTGYPTTADIVGAVDGASTLQGIASRTYVQTEVARVVAGDITGTFATVASVEDNTALITALTDRVAANEDFRTTHTGIDHSSFLTAVPQATLDSIAANTQAIEAINNAGYLTDFSDLQVTDIPDGIARDQEIADAITAHLNTATHGGGDGVTLTQEAVNPYIAGFRGTLGGAGTGEQATAIYATGLHSNQLGPIAADGTLLLGPVATQTVQFNTTLLRFFNGTTFDTPEQWVRRHQLTYTVRTNDEIDQRIQAFRAARGTHSDRLGNHFFSAVDASIVETADLLGLRTDPTDTSLPRIMVLGGGGANAEWYMTTRSTGATSITNIWHWRHARQLWAGGEINPTGVTWVNDAGEEFADAATALGIEVSSDGGTTLGAVQTYLGAITQANVRPAGDATVALGGTNHEFSAVHTLTMHLSGSQASVGNFNGHIYPIGSANVEIGSSHRPIHQLVLNNARAILWYDQAGERHRSPYITTSAYNDDDYDNPLSALAHDILPAGNDTQNVGSWLNPLRRYAGMAAQRGDFNELFVGPDDNHTQLIPDDLALLDSGTTPQIYAGVHNYTGASLLINWTNVTNSGTVPWPTATPGETISLGSVGTDILPATSDTHDLGASENWWQHAYFGNTSTNNLYSLRNGDPARDHIDVWDDLRPDQLGRSLGRSDTGRQFDAHLRNVTHYGAIIGGAAARYSFLSGSRINWANVVHDNSPFLGDDALTNLTTHIIPSANNVRDLGSPERRFNEGFFTLLKTTRLSANSAATSGDIGLRIDVNSDGELLFRAQNQTATVGRINWDVRNFVFTNSDPNQTVAQALGITEGGGGGGGATLAEMLTHLATSAADINTTTRTIGSAISDPARRYSLISDGINLRGRLSFAESGNIAGLADIGVSASDRAGNIWTFRQYVERLHYGGSDTNGRIELRDELEVWSNSGIHWSGGAMTAETDHAPALFTPTAPAGHIYGQHLTAVGATANTGIVTANEYRRPDGSSNSSVGESDAYIQSIFGVNVNATTLITGGIERATGTTPNLFASDARGGNAWLNEIDLATRLQVPLIEGLAGSGNLAVQTTGTLNLGRTNQTDNQILRGTWLADNLNVAAGGSLGASDAQVPQAHITTADIGTINVDTLNIDGTEFDPTENTGSVELDSLADGFVIAPENDNQGSVGTTTNRVHEAHIHDEIIVHGNQGKVEADVGEFATLTKKGEGAITTDGLTLAANQTLTIPATGSIVAETGATITGFPTGGSGSGSSTTVQVVWSHFITSNTNTHFDINGNHAYFGLGGDGDNTRGTLQNNWTHATLWSDSRIIGFVFEATELDNGADPKGRAIAQYTMWKHPEHGGTDRDYIQYGGRVFAFPAHRTGVPSNGTVDSPAFDSGGSTGDFAILFGPTRAVIINDMGIGDDPPWRFDLYAILA